jgi:predicted PurR-regulated permease PerM
MKKSPEAADAPKLERSFFFILLALLTVGFAAVVLPFYGAVFWGGVLALMFQPLYRKLLAKMRGRPNLAALATLGVIVLLVILPLALVGVSLVREATGVYARVKSGELNFGAYFDRIVQVLPGWLTGLLDRYGVADLAALQAKIVAALTQRSSMLAGRAVDIGGEALDLIVGFAIAMYLLFFLLRDGAGVARDIRAAIPLAPGPKERLLERFTTVIRATVKGNILVAAAQGALGGLAFWALGVHAPLLWGVVMAFLSLVPAVGAALIWAPVALYLLAVGEVWQGLGLILFGVFVIGLIDNVLRPILVGKDTAMPDYVVLIATLGGLALFGLNGFVIGPVIVTMFIAAWQLLASERLTAEQTTKATKATNPERAPEADEK